MWMFCFISIKKGLASENDNLIQTNNILNYAFKANITQLQMHIKCKFKSKIYTHKEADVIETIKCLPKSL